MVHCESAAKTEAGEGVACLSNELPSVGLSLTKMMHKRNGMNELMSMKLEQKGIVI
jgi:hypothetical protein